MLAVVVDMNGAESTVETFDKTGRSLPWLENLAGADAAAILVDDELGDFRLQADDDEFRRLEVVLYSNRIGGSGSSPSSSTCKMWQP